MRHAWERNAYIVLMGELEGWRPFGRTSWRLEHNTIIDVKERGLGFGTSAHPFISPSGTTGLPLNGFS